MSDDLIAAEVDAIAMQMQLRIVQGGDRLKFYKDMQALTIRMEVALEVAQAAFPYNQHYANARLHAQKMLECSERGSA